MLAYVLAIVIAMGSFSFYMAAFFVPEIHRRQDFFWSGVGLFYAVVLWFCAGRITGAVLLGQVASVALLGGLGWHTLTLRRALTPEAVRTPVSWEDLQRWGQGTRRVLQQYVKLGSLVAAVQAIAADFGTAIADLRNRTAGPRGMEPPLSKGPPLKRSPAYEFETEAGQGESIPSEFATVAPPPPPEASPSVSPTTAAPPSPEAAAAVPEAPTVEAEGAEPVAEAVPTPETATPARVAPQPPRFSRVQEAATPSPRTSPPPSVPKQKPQAKPAAKANPVAGLAIWVGDVVKGFRKPQPQRSVIEIPPRPPSIPRSPEMAKPETRPQRSPTVPTASEPPTAATNGPEDNWVDVGDEGSDVPPAIANAATDQESAEANWSESTSPQPREPAPASSPVEELDTNWPEDDEETNWPD